MNQTFQAFFIAWRFYLIIGLLILAIMGLIWRVFDLAVLDQHFLREQGDVRVVRLINSSAERGMIVDRYGFPLAVSTIVYSVWINPQEFKVTNTEFAQLTQILNLNKTTLRQLVYNAQKKKREFLYLKRGVAPETANVK